MFEKVWFQFNWNQTTSFVVNQDKLWPLATLWFNLEEEVEEEEKKDKEKEEVEKKET